MNEDLQDFARSEGGLAAPRKEASILQESEEKFWDLFQNLQIGVVVHGPDTAILYSNPMASRLLGLTTDQMQGKTATDSAWSFIREDGTRLPPDEYPVNRALVTPEDATSGSILGIRRPEPEGSVWFKCDTRLNRNANGQLRQIVITFFDITMHIRAEEALTASETRYRRLFETAKDGILILDAETGMVVDVNPFLTELLGLSHEVFLGRKVWELGFFKDIAANEAKFAELQAQKYVRYENLPLETADGRRIAVEFVSNVYLVNHQEVIQCNIRDISARTRAEAEQAHLAAIVQSSDDAIIGKNLQGIITSWNAAAEKIFGYSASEMVGQPVSRLVPPDRQAEEEDILARIRSGENVLHYETVRLCKDGKPLDVSLTISSIKDTAGRQIGASKIVRDITERKLAEEKIYSLNAKLEQRVKERTTELEAANKELESFAYSVSHDLRAPLRGIDGWSSALVEDYGDKLDDQGREYLARVCGEAQRMGQLIDELLQLSRLTRAEMRREQVDLSAMAHGILAALRQQERQRQVETVISSGLHTMGDPQLLQVVMQNLLENAWKFTGKCAEARIEFGVIEKGNASGLISTQTSNPPTTSSPVFFIRDNGAGFDMAHTAKLFAPFQRLHRQSEFPGTGVGLASAQRIIHRHGGRIWVVAEPAKGATFYFTLPTH